MAGGDEVKMEKTEKAFENGREKLLGYLNELVKSDKAALIEEKDEDYCETHETYMHHWTYNLKENKLQVKIYTGPFKNSTHYKYFDDAFIILEGSDKNVQAETMENLEKILSEEKK